MSNLPEQAERHSDIIIKNRRDFGVTGVIDVFSFDEYNVTLKTVLGDLLIDGEELKITKLSLETGEVRIEGKLSGIIYRDEVVTAGGFFKRLKDKNR